MLDTQSGRGDAPADPPGVPAVASGPAALDAQGGRGDAPADPPGVPAVEFGLAALDTQSGCGDAPAGPARVARTYRAAAGRHCRRNL
jgi:hypothetical protein